MISILPSFSISLIVIRREQNSDSVLFPIECRNTALLEFSRARWKPLFCAARAKKALSKSSWYSGELRLNTSPFHHRLCLDFQALFRFDPRRFACLPTREQAVPPLMHTLHLQT